jgi:hypothetical protein
MFFWSHCTFLAICSILLKISKACPQNLLLFNSLCLSKIPAGKKDFQLPAQKNKINIESDKLEFEGQLQEVRHR